MHQISPTFIYTRMPIVKMIQHYVIRFLQNKLHINDDERDMPYVRLRKSSVCEEPFCWFRGCG